MYQVVNTVIPGALEPAEPEMAQLDAPDGLFVVGTYWNVAGSGDPYRFGGSPFGGWPVLDDDGRITGFVFRGAGEVEGITSDVEVAIVCVD